MFLDEPFAKELFALLATERFGEVEIDYCCNTEMDDGSENEDDDGVVGLLRDVAP